MTKICSKCGIDKDLAEFELRSDTGKYRSYCKVCTSERSKRYYLKNRDKILSMVHNYVMSNPDKVKTRNRRYYQSNRDKVLNSNKRWRQDNIERALEYEKRYQREYADEIREYNREYEKKNIEKVRAYKRKYKKSHPEKVFQDSCKRRINKLNIKDFGLQKEEYVEVLRKFDFKCFNCKSNEILTIDHHYPLSKGFKMELSNAVLLCRNCNCRKHNKMPEEFYTSEQLEQLKDLGIEKKSIQGEILC